MKSSEVPLSKNPSAGLSARDEEGGLFAYFLYIDGLEAALQQQRHELECALRGGAPKKNVSSFFQGTSRDNPPPVEIEISDDDHDDERQPGDHPSSADQPVAQTMASHSIN